MTARRSRIGFSLVELLVVVAVVLILGSILLVAVDAVFTYAIQLKCQHRMEQVYHGCLLYAVQYHGQWPEAFNETSLEPWYYTLTAGDYLDNPEAIACPSSEREITAGEVVMADTGPPPPEVTTVTEAVEKGLWFLASQQHSDGLWPKTGSGGNSNANTAFALMAFLGAGKNDADPEFGTYVRDAIEYLIQADPEGDGYVGGQLYEHAIVTMALCDSVRLVSDPALKASATTAANAALLYMLDVDPIHPEDGGYDPSSYMYGAKYSDALGCSAADNSLSAWLYQALGAGVWAGLNVNPNDFQPVSHVMRAREWADRSTDPIYGTVGYTTSQPTKSNPRMTPHCLAARLYVGDDPKDPSCTLQADWITKPNDNRVKAWIEDTNPDGGYGGVGGIYTLYASTVALYLMGGSYWEEWEPYAVGLLLNPSRNMPQPVETWNGHETAKWPSAIQSNSGNWDPLGGYGLAGQFDDVATTALACLVLETTYAEYVNSKWSAEITVTAGGHSYGYNKLIADKNNRRRKPASDTIVLMDYTLWGIGADDEPMECIAPRHGGKANVLFGDGRVETRTFEELTERNAEGNLRIKEHMLSLQPGPDLLPEEEQQEP